MTVVCIIDTSVFCNILGIPNRSQQHQQTMDDLNDYIEASATLLLPMATIYETGNHIAQNGDGQIRRTKANLFVTQVQGALAGTAPWTPTPLDSLKQLNLWLTSFPDWAMQGSGLGDLSIKQVYEIQCQLNPSKDVFIWSYDQHLNSYSRPATV